MRPETANYYGILFGLICALLHLIYGRWRSSLWPSFVRLGMSFLAGMGLTPVLQIAPLVATPPDTRPNAVPVTIRVDDCRAALALAMLALIALSAIGLRDNLLEINRQKPSPRPSGDVPPHDEDSSQS